MASRLAEVHRDAQRRLRAIVAGLVAGVWNDLPGYNQENVDQFLSLAVPYVLAGQRQSVALTEAYLARALNRLPIGVDPGGLIGPAVRNGTPVEEEWRRPFVKVWSALDNGTEWEQAVGQGLGRATGLADADVQLTSRATFQAVQDADPGIFGYQRTVGAGACRFCRTVAGAYVKNASAMPLHPHCTCTLFPLVEEHSLAVFLPDGTRIREFQGGPLINTPTPADVAVHEHGELGAVLTDPASHFTSKAEALGT